MNNIKDLRILVVEDNGTFRKLLAAMIERITGTNPMIASDGEEAVMLATQHTFDLIFMDNHMPNLTGIEATEIIRNSQTQQPHIIGISGSSNHKDLKDLLGSGMNELLSKPFHMDELAQFIHDACNSKSKLLAVA